jgi:hypothetical protein
MQLYLRLTTSCVPETASYIKLITTSDIPGYFLGTKGSNPFFNIFNPYYGLEVNTEKTKYMLLSRHQNGGQNHYIKIGNRCFGNVEQFR